MSNPLLKVNNLSIHFHSENGFVKAVEDSSFTIKKGETIGIVGESGSGKSITALSIMQLLPKVAKMPNGAILFEPIEEATELDLTTLEKGAIEKIRGSKIAMIFQEPMTSLNPVMTCGKQVVEAIQLHQRVSFQTAKKETIQLFNQVKLPDVERIFNAYPHQLSGGQKQRIMIAMALSCRPTLLIADEPTTALDVTVQKGILALLNELKNIYQLSILFISHDLGVIKKIADKVLVMKKGKIVETGTVDVIFNQPQHPYTKGLLACRPSLNQHLKRLPTVEGFEQGIASTNQLINQQEIAIRKQRIYSQGPFLEVQHLSTWYPAKKNFWGKTTNFVKAVDDVSFEVFKGETFGLVGESGCGKSTLGRTILGLEEAKTGKILYDSQDLLTTDEANWNTLRKKMQIIFQDPYSALNPTQPIGLAIMEPMKVHRLWKNEKQYQTKAIDLLETVGLRADQFMRFPHEFSGGQRQRICIARALALQPEFIICDECVSSLDVSIQAQILNLLIDLREKFDLTYIFISHDLSVVQFISDRIMVMKDGKKIEIGDANTIFTSPQSEYTKKLIGAIL